MRPKPSPLAVRVLMLLAGLLVVKVTAQVVANYPDYLPPRFTADFLRGREPHFWGTYHWAFTTHILAGPGALILGLVLVNPWVRARWPRWHRTLGWVQVGGVVLLIAPSGLVMARYAAAGPVGGLGLALLAATTAGSAVCGVRSARLRRFADHRRWMWRCYLLLCSAVVLRMLGGLATVLEITVAWFDPLAIWVSWLGPLAVFEVRERLDRQR